MAGDKLTFAAIVLVAIVAIVGMIGLMGFGPVITGASTTAAGTASITVSQLICITLDDATIAFGSGAVTQDSEYSEVYGSGQDTLNGSWTNVSDPFELRNCGNEYLNVTVKIDDKDFMGGVGGKSWYNGTDDVSPGEAGSCITWGVTEGAWTEFTADNTLFNLCNNMSFADATNELRIDMKLRIPDDAPQASPSATVTFNAAAA